MKKITFILFFSFLAYLFYNFYLNYFSDNLSHNFTKKELQGNFFEKTISRILINFFSTDQAKESLTNLSNSMQKTLETLFSEQINDDLLKISHYLVPLFYLKSDKQGQGTCIICGQKFKAKYQILDANMDILYEKDEEAVLGAQNLLREINMLVPGMQKGETVFSVFANSFNEKDDNKSLQLDPYVQKIFIKLTDIEQAHSLNTNHIYIFDSQNTDLNLVKEQIICGNKISFQFKIIDLVTKQVVFDLNDHTLVSFVGESALPIIFNYVLHTKPVKSTRSVICDGKYLKMTSNQKGGILPSNFDKSSIVDEHIYMLVIYNTSIIPDKDILS